MTKTTYPTLQEIRNAHSWKREYERYLPLSRFVFRPVGFLLTWIAVRIGLTTETAAWLSGFVALMGYICLISNREYLLPIGISLLLLFNLLDCVDGSIARTMKTENPYGRFLDSIMGWVDMGFWAVIGVMAYRHQQLLCFSEPMGYSPVFWLVAGGLTSYFFILLGFVESTFDQCIRDEWDGIKGKSSKDLTNKSKNLKEDQIIHRETPPFSIARIINHNLRVRETHYLLLILTFWYNVIDLLLIGYLFYFFAHTILLIIIYNIRGRQLCRYYKEN